MLAFLSTPLVKMRRASSRTRSLGAILLIGLSLLSIDLPVVVRMSQAAYHLQEVGDVTPRDRSW